MCFTLGWIEQLLVWIVIVIAVVAVIKLLLPWLSSLVPGGGLVTSIISIVLWAVIAIAVIYFVFALISCVAAGGGGFPLFPHGR